MDVCPSGAMEQGCTELHDLAANLQKSRAPEKAVSFCSHIFLENKEMNS